MYNKIKKHFDNYKETATKPEFINLIKRDLESNFGKSNKKGK